MDNPQHLTAVNILHHDRIVSNQKNEVCLGQFYG